MNMSEGSGGVALLPRKPDYTQSQSGVNQPCATDFQSAVPTGISGSSLPLLAGALGGTWAHSSSAGVWAAALHGAAVQPLIATRHSQGSCHGDVSQMDGVGQRVNRLSCPWAWPAQAMGQKLIQISQLRKSLSLVLIILFTFSFFLTGGPFIPRGESRLEQVSRAIARGSDKVPHSAGGGDPDAASSLA